MSLTWRAVTKEPTFELTAFAVCDECGKEELMEGAPVGWIETSAYKLDIATFGELPIGGHFCGDACLIAYFTKRQARKK